MKEIERVSAAVQIPEGATDVRFWLRLQDDSGGAPSDGVTHTDSWVAALGDSEEEALYRVSFYHDETFTPDPDLTAQPRPGGGSQLVGTQVAGLTATGGVVVQSEQWAKSGGVSGRIINNTGEPVTVTIDDASVFTRLWTYDGAKETLATLTSPSVIPGPATLGESKWVDLITSTAQRYDGPLFSGSTPNSADDSGYGWVSEWLGAPDASASMREFTQVSDTAVRVVEDLDAPAVGITVEGLSSVETSRIAIYRQTPGKERTLVQGLGNVDVDGAGYWVDYLPPLGVPVTY
ncbi:MAG TPA: hypothetical protein VK054_04900, partial [Beutenbergiaceae bacterium]|nr:hypothetical protein [Beutenbergiaceae bacterium]